MKLYQSVIVAGGKGMLAQAIIALLQRRRVPFISIDVDTCDITREAAVRPIFSRMKPSLVINCAAHTKVDVCEQEREKADQVNGAAVGIIATAAWKYDAKVVHFSTDFVFDGTLRRPYRPDDAPHPLSAYGRSKLLGERRLQEVDPPGWLIVRTAWLYGLRGLSFPRAIVERARANMPLKVVNDQIGCPTYTADLAAGVLELIDHDAKGLWHWCNSSEVNWYDFARAVLEEFGLKAEIEAITAAEWAKMKPGSAPRPAYSVLDTTAYTELTGKTPRPWREALHDYRRAVGPAAYDDAMRNR